MEPYLIGLLIVWCVFWYGVSFPVIAGDGKLWLKILITLFGGPLAFFNGFICFTQFIGGKLEKL